MSILAASLAGCIGADDASDATLDETPEGDPAPDPPQFYGSPSQQEDQGSNGSEGENSGDDDGEDEGGEDPQVESEINAQETAAAPPTTIQGPVTFYMGATECDQGENVNPLDPGLFLSGIDDKEGPGSCTYTGGMAHKYAFNADGPILGIPEGTLVEGSVWMDLTLSTSARVAIEFMAENGTQLGLVNIDRDPAATGGWQNLSFSFESSNPIAPGTNLTLEVRTGFTAGETKIAFDEAHNSQVTIGVGL